MPPPLLLSLSLCLSLSLTHTLPYITPPPTNIGRTQERARTSTSTNGWPFEENKHAEVPRNSILVLFVLLALLRLLGGESVV